MESHEEMLVLNRVLVGDSPIAFDVEWNVRVGGHWMAAEEWEALRDRIDQPLARANKIKKFVGGTRSFGSHPFLTGNLKYINSATRGHIKRAPWWLRWLFEGVVDKSKLEA